jgi:hypothetical protein
MQLFGRKYPLPSKGEGTVLYKTLILRHGKEGVGMKEKETRKRGERRQQTHLLYYII